MNLPLVSSISIKQLTIEICYENEGCKISVSEFFLEQNHSLLAACAELVVSLELARCWNRNVLSFCVDELLRINHRLMQRPRKASSLQEGRYSLCPCQVQHTLAHDLFLLFLLFSQNLLTLIFSALDEWLVEGFLTGRGDLNRTNSERII